MQITHCTQPFYHAYSYGYRQKILRLQEKNPPEIQDPQKLKALQEKVERWDELTLLERSKSEKEAKIGISQTTYYRYKKRIQTLLQGKKLPTTRPKNVRKSKGYLLAEAKIIEIRNAKFDDPEYKYIRTYGKEKLKKELEKYGIYVSTGTVGRIIKSLTEAGIIQRSHAAPPLRRSRNFDAHAKRLPYKMKSQKKGELVQIDHMTVTKGSKTFKEFHAIDPVTRWLVVWVTSNATSAAAARFLDLMIKRMPFDITSIQVDGGSEFMAAFEEATQKKGLDHYVLPPRRPQLNGRVERSNGILRTEVYLDNTDIATMSIKEINALLDDYTNHYNTKRPHKGIGLQTPQAYAKLTMETSENSHIC